MKDAKCPYCGKKIGYFKKFYIHNQGEYFCDKCKKESNVVIKKTIIIPFIIAVLLAAAVLVYFFMFTNKQNLWFMLWVALPFIVFYFFTPIFITLKPRKKHIDALYDMQLVEATIPDSDPTVVKKSRVVPAFVDDVVLDDDNFKPSIEADVFQKIKEERKALNETDGNTKAFSRYEEISSQKDYEQTMPVNNIKEVAKEKAVKEDKEQEMTMAVPDLKKEKNLSHTAELLNNIDKLISEENIEEPQKVIEEDVKVFTKEEPEKDEEVKVFEKDDKFTPPAIEKKEEAVEKEEEKVEDKTGYDLSLFE